MNDVARGNEQMVVRCWGVRGSHPVPNPAMARYGGNTPCVEIRAPGGGRLVVDAGTGIIDLGAEIEDIGEVDLLLSHLHWDHLQGLPFFAPLFQGVRLRVWSEREPAEVEAALRLQLCGPYFPIEFSDLPVELELHRLDGAQEIAGVVVSPFSLQHPGGSTGFRMEHAGRVVVYATDHEIGDTEVDAGVVETASGADLMIIDAQYEAATAIDRRGWGHSGWEEAVDLGREAQVRQLLMFHHDPGSSDEHLDRVQANARQRFPGASVAVERREYRTEAP